MYRFNMIGWNKIFYVCGIYMKVREVRFILDKKKRFID